MLTESRWIASQESTEERAKYVSNAVFSQSAFAH